MKVSRRKVGVAGPLVCAISMMLDLPRSVKVFEVKIMFLNRETRIRLLAGASSRKDKVAKGFDRSIPQASVRPIVVMHAATKIRGLEDLEIGDFWQPPTFLSGANCTPRHPCNDRASFSTASFLFVRTAVLCRADALLSCLRRVSFSRAFRDEPASIGLRSRPCSLELSRYRCGELPRPLPQFATTSTEGETRVY